MSDLDRIENSSSTENEQINQYEDYNEYGEDFSKEGSLPPDDDHGLAWRKNARNFLEAKSSVSTCHDSDYDAWLENYYNEVYKAQTSQSYATKEVDVCSICSSVAEKPENFLTSLFPPLKKDVWSFSTKYWGPKDVRRHWPLPMKRGKFLFLPSIHPHLNLRSRYGRYHSLMNSAAAVPEPIHKKICCIMFKKILEGLENTEPHLQKIMVCDSLCNLKWFDYMSKKSVSRCFCRFIRKQNHLEKVYFENAGLERLEGIVFLCALSRSGGNTIKELHLWKMFGHGESPVLFQELSSKGDFLRTSENIKFFTKIHYLQILNKFSNLTHLSVNYGYLANQTGDALLCLKSVRLGNLKTLRLLCVKDERPLLTNPGYGVGGWKIADGVWKRAVEWCPDLRVSFVFLNMPQYENVILFLSKSIPVSNVYLSSGIDFTFEVPWDIDSTLLELRNWYAPTLEHLSLHLWHHRDLLDFVIRRKILEEFPNLINFEFIGVLEDIETLEDFCGQLTKGTYSSYSENPFSFSYNSSRYYNELKTLLFWVEEKYSSEKDLVLTRKRVAEIHSKYRKKFTVMSIDADLQTYAL